MRRLVFGTLGATAIGLGGPALAQDASPAARLGGIQAVIPAADSNSTSSAFRGQSPAGLPLPMSRPVPGPASTTATTWTPQPGTFGDPQGTGGIPVVVNGPAGSTTVVPPMFAGAADPAVAGPWWWVSGEALIWWSKGQNLPPLLTTSSPQFNGILGTGDTQVLLGGSQPNGFQPGFRLEFGRWLGCDHLWALTASFFYLPKQTDTYTADSSQYPVLARPFVNLNQNSNYVELMASPGLASGSFQVRQESTLWGGDVNLRRYLGGNACRRLDLIGGFRYLSLDERLDMTETFARTPGSNLGIGVPDAVSGVVTDSFHTQNKFYGGQLGLQWEGRYGRWFTDLKGKVALGAMHSTVNIDGSQQITLNTGATQTAAGGLLAVPGNIGSYTQTKFAWVPEMGINLGYHITPRLRATVGYNLLYVSHVLRPGDQIDTGLDVTRIPNFPVPGATPLPAVRPSPTMSGTDYWAQGINLGLQFTW